MKLPTVKRYWAYPLALLLSLAGCERQQLVVLPGRTMGTTYSVKYIYHPPLPSPKRIHSVIEKKLAQINLQMSTYRPDSELSRFNQSEETGKPFPVSLETITVVKEAQRLHRVTQGGLDVTIGPLVNLWGFGPEGRANGPPQLPELLKRRAWTGMDKLSLKPQGLIKSVPQLSVDLSAIAKGFAVDQIADFLASQGVENYLVEIGGELRLCGNNLQNRPWRVAIEDPTWGRSHNVQQLITPGNNAVATSGDYNNYFENDGRHYSHTINPHTGKPVANRIASITVLHPSCMTADGLATGLNALGPERAIQLADQLQIPILLILRGDGGFEKYYSEAFMPYLAKEDSK